jgi:hypothetical protein
MSTAVGPNPVTSGGTGGSGAMTNAAAGTGGSTGAAGGAGTGGSGAGGFEPFPTGCQGWTGDFFATRASSQAPPAIATAIDLYPSNGDGTFAPVWTISIGESYQDVVISDFDGDGSLEILTWGAQSGRRYLLDFCTDTSKWYVIPTQAPDPIPYEIHAAGDFNNDGVLDLFGWDKNHLGYTSIGTGGGSFTHVASSFDVASLFVYSLAAAFHARDVTGDGCADLVLSKVDADGDTAALIYLFTGDCTGMFTPALDVPPGNAPGHIATLPGPANGHDLADIDKDGLVDLLSGLDDDGDPGQCWWLKGTGTTLDSPVEAFDVFPLVDWGLDGAGDGSIRLYDWDSDQKPEVLVGFTLAFQSEPEVQIRMGTGDGTFSPPGTVIPQYTATATWIAVPVK